MSQKLTLSVPNISCGHCVARIEKALGEMEGVSAVSADAATKHVEVETGDDAAISEAVKAKLGEIGYPSEAE